MVYICTMHHPDEIAKAYDQSVQRAAERHMGADDDWCWQCGEAIDDGEGCEVEAEEPRCADQRRLWHRACVARDVDNITARLSALLEALGVYDNEQYEMLTKLYESAKGAV